MKASASDKESRETSSLLSVVESNSDDESGGGGGGGVFSLSFCFSFDEFFRFPAFCLLSCSSTAAAWALPDLRQKLPRERMLSNDESGGGGARGVFSLSFCFSSDEFFRFPAFCLLSCSLTDAAAWALPDLRRKRPRELLRSTFNFAKSEESASQRALEARLPTIDFF